MRVVEGAFLGNELLLLESGGAALMIGVLEELAAAVDGEGDDKDASEEEGSACAAADVLWLRLPMTTEPTKREVDRSVSAWPSFRCAFRAFAVSCVP